MFDSAVFKTGIHMSKKELGLLFNESVFTFNYSDKPWI